MSVQGFYNIPDDMVAQLSNTLYTGFDSEGSSSGSSGPTTPILHSEEAFNSSDESTESESNAPDVIMLPNGERLIEPRYTYASLIAQSIMSIPDQKMLLQDIYAFITENYRYYQFATKQWQNSIRHNLSLHKAFQKVPRQKGTPGKGNYWTIVPEYQKFYVNNEMSIPKGYEMKKTSDKNGARFKKSKSKARVRPQPYYKPEENCEALPSIGPIRVKPSQPTEGGLKARSLLPNFDLNSFSEEITKFATGQITPTPTRSTSMTPILPACPVATKYMSAHNFMVDYTVYRLAKDFLKLPEDPTLDELHTLSEIVQQSLQFIPEETLNFDISSEIEIPAVLKNDVMLGYDASETPLLTPSGAVDFLEVPMELTLDMDEFINLEACSEYNDY